MYFIDPSALVPDLNSKHYIKMGPGDLVVGTQYCWKSNGVGIGAYETPVVSETAVLDEDGHPTGTTKTVKYYKFSKQTIHESSLSIVKVCPTSGGKRKSRSRKYRNKRKSRKNSKKFN